MGGSFGGWGEGARTIDGRIFGARAKKIPEDIVSSINASEHPTSNQFTNCPCSRSQLREFNMQRAVAALIILAVAVECVPVQDAPDVAAAKAEHFAAVNAARARVGAPPLAPFTTIPLPVQDTAEVAAAKAAHFAAVNAERARVGAALLPLVSFAVPVQDEPDVAAAKAQHFAAVNAARARVGAAPLFPFVSFLAPVEDTLEVKLAKAEFFAAFNAAAAAAAAAGDA